MVTCISATIQEYKGERFYLCGNYFQHNGKRLHRTVWESNNGEIPKGYDVHHIDGDKTNNEPENLELLKRFDHHSLHGKKNMENHPENIAAAQKAAPEWHRSEEGTKWHSKHAIEYWSNAPMQTYTCSFCRKEYQTRAIRLKGNHFCSNNCKAAFRRRRIRCESQGNPVQGES